MLRTTWRWILRRTWYPSTLKNPDTTFVYGINVGDMNLDGHMDVITADADILYDDGTGALALTPQSAFEWHGDSPLVPTTRAMACQTYCSVRTEDLR